MNAGSATLPLCSIAHVPQSLAALRRVVVVRGVVEGALALSAGDAPVSVVGQNTAILVPALSAGIRVTGGELYVRSLAVEDSRDVGVIAEGEGVIRLDRVRLQGNRKGGLRALGRGFDVTNSVFIANGGQLDGSRSIGGAWLGPAAPSAPNAFAFNTVVSSVGAGVTCNAGSQLLFATLLANGTDVLGTCVLSESRSTSSGGLNLVDGWRLGAGSSCRNAVATAPADAPLFDFDGDVRPLEGKFDCGADEFKP